MKTRTLVGNLMLLCVMSYSNAASGQFKVVGYLPTWSAMYPANITAINLSKLTHLHIAFANPDATGRLIPANGTDADVATAATIAHAHNLQVLLSLGGESASGTNYHDLITRDPTSLVIGIVTYATSNNLDGIDLDIEGNILDGTTLTASQYESFVTQLGAALHARGKIMSAALATAFGDYVTTVAASRFDYINIMSYDATGPWAPTQPGQHSPHSMTLSDFEYWNGTKAVPRAKLNLGVPFYGYGFGKYANQGISYCDIVHKYPGSEQHDQIGSGPNAIYYNGIPTIIQKTTHALHNAGGIMMWELTQDCGDTLSLLSAIGSVVSSQSTNRNSE